MNIASYQEYINYTHWANNKVIGWLQQLTEDQLTQPVVSSFGSVIETVHHIISAEHVWIQRLTGVTPVWLQPTLPKNLTETIDQWNITMQLWKVYAASLSDSEIERSFSFNRINGDQLTMTVKDVILHVQNHSTQHRGQLVTMLRQVGFIDISSLDLFTFYTKND